MRLAQIARKVQEKPSEIRAFIKKKFDQELENDPNVKLEDEQVNAILKEFSKKEEEVIEKTPQQEIVEEIPIDESVETDLESLKEIAEEEIDESPVEIPETQEVSNEPTTEEVSSADKKVANIDKESSDLATDEKAEGDFNQVEVDPDAELITAKVEKLEGIKVIGKIELPEDKLPEAEELPTVDSIEAEIDELDGEIDTSTFPDMMSSEESEEKEAIFAELDAAMEQVQESKVKPVINEASEVIENQEEDEHSIYKNAKGEYRFTPEQKANRRKSVAQKEKRERENAIKEKKKRYYRENVAAKVQKPEKKKKDNTSSQKQRKNKDQQEPPKGLWQRFMNWLYD